MTLLHRRTRLPKGWSRQIPNHNEIRNGKLWRSREYQSWINMMTRCYSPSSRTHKYRRHYIGKVYVATRWIEFSNFLEDMGERPEGMSLDRIDSSRHYTPDNVRWATHSTQMYNRRKWGKGISK